MRRANSLEPLADATMERWFTDAFKASNPGRWKQIRDTVAATTPAGFLGCSAAIMKFDFTPSCRRCPPWWCAAPGRGHSARRPIAGLVPGGRYEEIARPPFPECRAPDAFNRIMIGWLAKHK